MNTNIKFVYTVLACWSFMLHLIQQVKRSTEDFAPVLNTSFLLGLATWLAYGFNQDHLTLIMANLLTAASACIVLHHKYMAIQLAKEFQE